MSTFQQIIPEIISNPQPWLISTYKRTLIFHKIRIFFISYCLIQIRKVKHIFLVYNNHMRFQNFT